MPNAVYLHAGAPKTGTSAIQVAVVRHRDLLESRNVFYPRSRSDDLAKKGLVTSGNGSLLSHLWDANCAFAQLTEQISSFAQAIEAHAGCDVLYSSEFFSRSLPTRLSSLLLHATRFGYEIKIIYYVRHLLDAAISQYVQAVRGGQTQEFDTWLLNSKQRYNLELRTFAEVVGRKNVIVKLYDDEKHRLTSGFLSLFGILDLPNYIELDALRVNRSLTQDEIRILLRVNSILQKSVNATEARKVIKQLNEDLVRRVSPLSSRRVVTEGAFRKFAELNSDVLDEVNRFVDGAFQVKMKSDEVEVGVPSPEILAAKDLAFLSIVESLLHLLSRELEEVNATSETKQGKGGRLLAEL